jgi:hypothetical protein
VIQEWACTQYTPAGVFEADPNVAGMKVHLSAPP